MIEIRGVTKRFKNLTALDNISLQIRDGEFYGLLGPNGAGKSTLMNLLTGYLHADTGEIYISGEKIAENNTELHRSIGLVPQSIALYEDLNAEQNMELFGSLYDIPGKKLKEIIKEKLNSVQLYDRRKDKVKTFSGGMKRRLNLITSIIHDPQILLCDEPTVGVDPQSRNALFDYLSELNSAGKTIIYTTHYMEEAERLCEKLAIIDLGRIIAEGSVETLINKLPYEQTISVTKNQDTIHKISLFSKFGDIVDETDKFELKPDGKFVLSEFFCELEKAGISYQSISIKRPSLEALFLHLTGRRLRD